MKKWLPLNCGAGVGCGMLGHSEDSRWLSEACRRFNDTSRSPSKDARTGIDSGMAGTRCSWKLTTPKLLADSGKWCLWLNVITEWCSGEREWCIFDKPSLGTELMSLGGGGRFCNSYLELMLLHQHKSLKLFERSNVSFRFSSGSVLEKPSLSHRSLGADIAISCSKSLLSKISLSSRFPSCFSSPDEFPSFNSSGKVPCSSEKTKNNFTVRYVPFVKSNQTLTTTGSELRKSSFLLSFVWKFMNHE